MWKITLRRLVRRIQICRRYIPRSALRRRKIIVSLLVFAVLAAAVIIRLEPAMEKMSVFMVNTVVTEYLNDAISEKIKEGNLEYNSLVTIEKDASGDVTALVTNMAKINILQTEITAYVIDKLSEQMKTSIKIPLGNIIGGTLLSGRGPGIPVKILSVSNVSAKFTNEFSTAGINQTRHQIIIDFTVDIDMLIPGGTVRDTVDASIVVAETVIVGDVPGTYAEFSGR